MNSRNIRGPIPGILRISASVAVLMLIGTMVVSPAGVVPPEDLVAAVVFGAVMLVSAFNAVVSVIAGGVAAVEAVVSAALFDSVLHAATARTAERNSGVGRMLKRLIRKFSGWIRSERPEVGGGLDECRERLI